MPKHPRYRFFSAQLLRVTFLALLGCLALNRSLASDGPASSALRDLSQYTLAKSNYLANSNSPEFAWKFARACYDWADHATNDAQLAALAQEGIAAARFTTNLVPTHAPAHFYLGMNLGQLARTKTLGALPIVQEMERRFLRAIELDPKFHYAGPHRSLGRLYLSAPGWPASVGSKPKAREHLEKAVELFPDYPENHLFLLDAYLQWDDETALSSALARYRKILPQARQKYAGPDWKFYWEDWNQRWRKILEKSNQLILE